MRKITNEFETLAKDLGLYRDILEVGSIERFASDLDVTSQTIRNFENGSCYNMTIMLYYYYKIDIVLNGDYRLAESRDAVEEQFKKMMNTETNGEYGNYEMMLFRRHNN